MLEILGGLEVFGDVTIRGKVYVQDFDQVSRGRGLKVTLGTKAVVAGLVRTARGPAIT